MEENKKKEKRVGTYTFGLMMILIGISVIIMTFTKFDFIKYVLMLWPVVLICLGIEIVYLNTKSDIKVKVDFGSIILMCAVLFFTGIFSVGNYFVNKVLYDDEVKGLIINQYVNKDYGRVMGKEITIQTDENDKVKVKVVEDEDYKDSSYVKIKLKVDTDNKVKIKDVVDLQDNLYDDFNDSTVILNKLPDYIKEVQVTINTENADNVKYDGTIIK